MASLATAWVDIVPRFKDLSSTFNKELNGIDATGAGTKLGTQLGNGLTTGVRSGGSKLADMFTGVTKTAVKGFGKIGKIGLGAITTIGGGITALAAKGGFTRALNIENAQAKLKGLGHTTEEITEIMANANAAVKGTAYGLDEAATVAASAVASGIKPGEQLTQVLKTIGDTAQIAGMGFSDAGAIFTSVMARGKLQGDDMLQLTSRGVPVLQALSDQLGVSTQDVSDMVSSGEIDFRTFATAMDKYLGGSALAAGETFTGALANVKAALSRLGQKAATPALNALRDMFNVLTPVIDKVNTALQPLADRLGTKLADAVQAVTPWIQRFADGMADGSISIQDIIEHVSLLVGAFAGFTGSGANDSSRTTTPNSRYGSLATRPTSLSFHWVHRRTRPANRRKRKPAIPSSRSPYRGSGSHPKVYMTLRKRGCAFIRNIRKCGFPVSSGGANRLPMS